MSKFQQSSNGSRGDAVSVSIGGGELEPISAGGDWAASKVGQAVSGTEQVVEQAGGGNTGVSIQDKQNRR